MYLKSLKEQKEKEQARRKELKEKAAKLAERDLKAKEEIRIVTEASAKA